MPSSGSPSTADTPALAIDPVSRLDAQAGQPNSAASAASDARAVDAQLDARRQRARRRQVELADQRGSGSLRQRSIGSTRSRVSANVSGVSGSSGCERVGRQRARPRASAPDRSPSRRSPRRRRRRRAPARPPPTATIVMSIVGGAAGNVDRLPGRRERFVGQLDALRGARRRSLPPSPR